MPPHDLMFILVPLVVFNNFHLPANKVSYWRKPAFIISFLELVLPGYSTQKSKNIYKVNRRGRSHFEAFYKCTYSIRNPLNILHLLREISMWRLIFQPFFGSITLQFTLLTPGSSWCHLLRLKSCPWLRNLVQRTASGQDNTSGETAFE